jgi:hypothetical protein
MIRGALEYAFSLSEDPKEIKKNMEQFLAKLGIDRRYKVKWHAVSGNSKHTFSGIFEYCGQKYYFNKMLGKLELEKI